MRQICHIGGRPLAEEQVAYAALDAFVLLQLYHTTSEGGARRPVEPTGEQRAGTS